MPTNSLCRPRPQTVTTPSGGVAGRRSTRPARSPPDPTGPLDAGRVGASLMSGVGLADLVAQTPDEYVGAAAGLAAEPGRRARLRSTLREVMRRSPLMDGPRFAGQVEAAYRQMWMQCCAAEG